MTKIILADKTTFTIEEQAGLQSIKILAADYMEVKAIEDALTKPGNLDLVKFTTDDLVTGEYENLKLATEIFNDVKTIEGSVRITFGLAEKTELEITVDMLTKGYEVHDGAIADLADAVSTIAEGGVE